MIEAELQFAERCWVEGIALQAVDVCDSLNLFQAASWTVMLCDSDGAIEGDNGTGA